MDYMVGTRLLSFAFKSSSRWRSRRSCSARFSSFFEGIRLMCSSFFGCAFAFFAALTFFSSAFFASSSYSSPPRLRQTRFFSSWSFFSSSRLRRSSYSGFQ